MSRLNLVAFCRRAHRLTRVPRNAVNYVSESVQGAGSQAEKRGNQGSSPHPPPPPPHSFSRKDSSDSRKTEVAKDSDASIGTRATAAKDAMGSKMDETSHNVRNPSTPLPDLVCSRPDTDRATAQTDQGGRPQGGCQALGLSPRAPHNVASVIGNTTHLSCQLRGCGTRFVLEGGSRRNGLYSTSLEASY